MQSVAPRTSTDTPGFHLRHSFGSQTVSLNVQLALRPVQAAKALGISTRTLWQWTKDGIIPHKRISGVILYPVDQLKEWLAQQAQAKGGQS
jgi:excisionase family DNA binding protein